MQGANVNNQIGDLKQINYLVGKFNKVKDLRIAETCTSTNKQ
jgi:hypothetical protein